MFVSSTRAGISSSWPNIFGEVESSVKNGLFDPMKEGEIRSAIFSIGLIKAPIKDGIPTIFSITDIGMCARKR